MHTQPDTHMPIGPRVKTYYALLTQSGTNPPVATVLQNTLGFTPIWRRDSQGSYSISNMVNTELKTMVTGAYILDNGPSTTQIGWGNNLVYINSYTNQSVSDDTLNETPIKIELFE